MAKETENSREMLGYLYQELYGSKITMANLDELAADLSQIADRPQPWTGKYLHSLLKGYEGFKPNQRLIEAVYVLTARLDGQDEVAVRAREVKVSALNDLPDGTVVLGEARRCAAPGCSIRFVPTHPRQKYHSKACAKIARRQRRRRRRQS